MADALTLDALTLADFDFALPPERIALRPAEPRDSARLMVVDAAGAISNRRVAELADLLEPGDMVVFNDTRVIPARLFGTRTREDSTVQVEATLHKRLDPSRWNAFMRPGKRLRPGDRVRFGARGEGAGLPGRLDAKVEAKGEGGEVTLAFDLCGPALDQAVREIGLTPLPPYIAAQRAEDARDRRDYQTVYAREEGSVAAPTAGLHFTPELLGRLAGRGIGQAFVTLHVGAGTFLPVKVENIAEHRMHAETGEVSPETAGRLNAARERGGRIVCVGTTSLRLLESCLTPQGRFAAFAGETDIFIRPGRPVRAADILMTNFHLPRSTLLMLVSALCGLERVRAGYAHALREGYRFYSYGDAGLWFRREPA